ncbi:TVP38/TMEM64 family protein [Rariglobus hedericola]|uniref:TVP38/TMEM64 family membrane protein n=1 Tax=Rariglobus hedericola TaxID=2597822 RepID=A0A556QN94_9BACT|nr:hypothetical protein [Rariglobus hedericola]TSJ78097.1 hypothetical protein FPL22_01945 [Rariglobus hedericola]
MDNRKKRLLGILGALVVIGCVVGLLAMQMDLGTQVKRCLEFVRAQGPGVFFLAMAVLPMFGFPLSPFIFSAGPVFAPTLGPGVVIASGMTALAVNVSLSYWFAAFALRPWLERLISWLGYPMPKLPAGRDWEFTLVVRVVPGTPFPLQSYLLGLARVKFWIYLLVSTLVPSGYLIAAVVAGDALVQGDKRKLVFAGILFAIVGTTLHFLRKRLAAKRALTRVPSDADKPAQTGA